MHFKGVFRVFNKYRGIEEIHSGKISMDEFLDQYSKRQIEGELLDYAWETRDMLQGTATTDYIGETGYPTLHGAEFFKELYGLPFNEYKLLNYEEQKAIVLSYEKTNLIKLHYVWTYAAIKFIDTYMNIFNDLIIRGKQK